MHCQVHGDLNFTLSFINSTISFSTNCSNRKLSTNRANQKSMFEQIKKAATFGPSQGPINPSNVHTQITSKQNVHDD